MPPPVGWMQGLLGVAPEGQAAVAPGQAALLVFGQWALRARPGAPHSLPPRECQVLPALACGWCSCACRPCPVCQPRGRRRLQSCRRTQHVASSIKPTWSRLGALLRVWLQTRTLVEVVRPRHPRRIGTRGSRSFPRREGQLWAQGSEGCRLAGGFQERAHSCFCFLETEGASLGVWLERPCPREGFSLRSAQVPAFGHSGATWMGQAELCTRAFGRTPQSLVREPLRKGVGQPRREAAEWDFRPVSDFLVE